MLIKLKKIMRLKANIEQGNQYTKNQKYELKFFNFN